jgi:glycogen synthase
VRVLIWGNSYPRVGGVETFITNLVEALTSRGVEVAVVSDGSVSLELVEPFPITMIPMTTALQAADPVAIMRVIASVRKLIARFRPDVIHYNLCGPEMFFFERVIRSSPVPFVMTLHNSAYAISDTLAAMFKRLIGKAFAVSAVSQTVYTGARRDLGDCAVSMRLIFNALPPKPASAPYPRNGHILALGRMVPEKGFATLVEAFALVRNAHGGARLTIAGAGPELDELKARADALEFGEAISFPGWINPDQVHHAMEEAAIIAFPSRWEEPFGLVALEAALAARPCVVTDVGELPSIVRDGETGWVVPRDDPPAMAAALSRLLDEPAKAEKMGARAKSWVDARYSFDAMVAAYAQLFDQAREARG